MWVEQAVQGGSSNKVMKAHRLWCEGRATQEGGRNLVLQVDRELQRGLGSVDCWRHCAIAKCPVDVSPSLEVLAIIPVSCLQVPPLALRHIELTDAVSSQRVTAGM